MTNAAAGSTAAANGNLAGSLSMLTGGLEAAASMGAGGSRSEENGDAEAGVCEAGKGVKSLHAVWVPSLSSASIHSTTCHGACDPSDGGSSREAAALRW
jgi:hypothetical protein